MKRHSAVECQGEALTRTLGSGGVNRKKRRILAASALVLVLSSLAGTWAHAQGSSGWCYSGWVSFNGYCCPQYFIESKWLPNWAKLALTGLFCARQAQSR